MLHSVLPRDEYLLCLGNPCCMVDPLQASGGEEGGAADEHPTEDRAPS